MNEQEIFAAALEQEASRRGSFLDEACAGDSELRRRIESLLKCHDQAGAFFEKPAADIVATAQLTPITETAGTQIGPYKLVEQIGEGGMGTVWMAQQSEPVKRLVAVKLIKAGMDSRQVIARFEAERQALALMDHPNIARVIDGGTTTAGRPYFVMDLVRGVPITRYCDEHHLTPRQRLELFIPVCQAIQHAHQKGIIHRDIKPSNVLVALYDGRPVPKVIDFGVAKAAGQPLTEQTLVTGFGAIVGTLEYMSPEQAELNQLDIDTRSDIYSLGVLLYELLTGSPPFSRKELEKAGMVEMLRVIREQEPSKPSTKLSTAEGLPTLAANRGTEPAKLTKLVRGELDWIVMKTLEKDRGRRYETANGFAQDVQRYLADEPVLACPPSMGYRLRKFVRKNTGRLAVAGMVLFFLVLLGSGAGWVWRDRAARQAARVSNLEHAVERAELLQREGKRREALAALERAQLLAHEAESASALTERIESLQQLLDAEGRDEVFASRFATIRLEIESDVNFEKSAFSEMTAYPAIRQALEDYGIAIGITSPDAVVTRIQERPATIQSVVIAALDECLRPDFIPKEDSHTRKWLIDVLEKADSDPWRDKVRQAWTRPATLEALAKDVDVRQQQPSFLVTVFARLPIESPSHWELARRVHFAYPGDFWVNTQLGLDLQQVGKPAEAIRYHTAALSLRPDNPGVLLNRGNALRAAGEFDAAVADLQRAIAVAPRYANVYLNLGLALTDQGKLDEAIDAYHQAIAIDPKFANAYYNLGRTLHDQNNLPEAINAYHKAIAIDPNHARAHCDLGVVLRDQRKLPEAIVAFRKAIEVDPKLANAYYNLGFALKLQGKLPEAIDALRKAIEIDPKLANACHSLGRALFAQGKLDEAAHFYRKCLEIDPKHVDACGDLGHSLAEQKKLPESIAAFRKAIEIDPNHAMAHNNLGVALAEEKRLSEAIAAFRKAIEIDPQHPLAHRNLAQTLRDQGELDQAIGAFQKAIAVNPQDAEAYSGLGNLFIDQQKWPEAIDAFHKAIEIEPTYPNAHFGLGIALYQHRNLKDAVDASRKAIKLSPTDAQAHCNLGLALLDQGKLDDAEATCREAIELDPTLANAHSILGSCLMRQNRIDDAIASFLKAIELDREFAAAHSNLGDALRRRGRFEEAIAAFRKAIDLDPKQIVPRQQLALLLSSCSDPKLRDPRLAVELAKKAVELERQSLNLMLLGWVQYRAGAWRESIEALEESCKRRAGGKGDAGRWIVLALAHARLAAQEGLPDKDREQHRAEAHRWYGQADKWIDSEWRIRPGDDTGQAIWDFREEARKWMAANKTN